ETAANTFNNILGEGAAPARRQVQQNQRNVVGRLNLDLGSCTDPTMVLLPGLNGRPQTEFTFIPANSAEFGGQQEALNPNIIANFICDTFTNRCDASEEAKAQCQIAKQAVAAVPERGQAAADRSEERRVGEEGRTRGLGGEGEKGGDGTQADGQ